MRKIILVFAAVLLASVGWSQSLNIHFKNGQSAQFNAENIEYVEFAEKTDNNTSVTSGEAIDLGLSVKWASCNVGATSPEQAGERYAWGETSTKSSFSLDNYIYFDSNTASYIDIGTEIGGTDYDVAHVKWGGNWRLPTQKEFRELADKCSWDWVKVNCVNGYKVTGSNGNSIFFPVINNKATSYWTSTLLKSEVGGKDSDAFHTFLDIGRVSVSTTTKRYNGIFIRPIMPK